MYILYSVQSWQPRSPVDRHKPAGTNQSKPHSVRSTVMSMSHGSVNMAEHWTEDSVQTRIHTEYMYIQSLETSH